MKGWKRWWAGRSVNQKLATVAFVLGLLGVGARTERGHVVALDTGELASIVGREADHVSTEDLAGWIVAGRADYRLIDLRHERDYAAYHIPTAENVALAVLPDAALMANEKVVLYSDGGLHAVQAWMLMRARGFRNVYTLRGGLEEWKDSVLFPTQSEKATPAERARFERIAAMARFFGGAPRTGTAAALAKAPDLPKIEAPMAPAGGPRSARKKKEGC